MTELCAVLLLCLALKILHHPAGSKVAGGPGRLKIKTTSLAVDVKDLAGKENARKLFAFECLKINLIELNAATGDKLFLEGGLS